MDKDTKQSLYQSEDGKDYIEISGYESKQIKTEEKKEMPHATESHDDFRDPSRGSEDGSSGEGTGKST